MGIPSIVVSYLYQIFYLYLIEATNGCNLGDVRVVSGNSSTEGRAEVCIAGQWGTICDDEWTDASANVLCGQAGFASVG